MRHCGGGGGRGKESHPHIISTQVKRETAVRTKVNDGQTYRRAKTHRHTQSHPCSTIRQQSSSTMQLVSFPLPHTNRDTTVPPHRFLPTSSHPHKHTFSTVSPKMTADDSPPSLLDRYTENWCFDTYHPSIPAHRQTVRTYVRNTGMSHSRERRALAVHRW